MHLLTRLYSMLLFFTVLLYVYLCSHVISTMLLVLHKGHGWTDNGEASILTTSLVPRFSEVEERNESLAGLHCIS